MPRFRLHLDVQAFRAPRNHWAGCRPPVLRDGAAGAVHVIGVQGRVRCLAGMSARTVLPVRALTDAIAFVEQMTGWISTSKARKGTNSAEAFSHGTVAGYFFPQASWNPPKRSTAALSFGAVQTGLRVSAILPQSWRAA